MQLFIRRGPTMCGVLTMAVVMSVSSAWLSAQPAANAKNTDKDATKNSAKDSGKDSGKNSVKPLELPAMNAAELKALAQKSEQPKAVVNWTVKHAALVDKASKTAALLQFFGDSITERISFYGMDAFERNFAALRPANFGISGDTSLGLFKRVNDGELGGHPKVIVLMIGTNDLGHGETAEDVSQNVARIVKTMQLKAPEAKILIMGLLPRLAPDSPFRGRILPELETVNAEIAQLANGKTIRYIDLGDKFKDANGCARKDLLPDYLHPNNAGYQVWSDAIKPIVDEMAK